MYGSANAHKTYACLSFATFQISGSFRSALLAKMKNVLQRLPAPTVQVSVCICMIACKAPVPERPQPRS